MPMGTPARTRGTPQTGGGSPAGRTRCGLRAGLLGTTGLFGSVLAATGPLMMVGGTLPTIFATTGIAGLPLLFTLVGAVLMLFAVGYAEMSRHIHSAGALYAYVARGLGGTLGAGAAALALAAYSLVQAGLYGLFGFTTAELLGLFPGVTVAWWAPAAVAVAVVGVLGRLPLAPVVRLLGVLLVAEVLAVLVFDAAALAGAGVPGPSPDSFGPGALTGSGTGIALSCCTIAFLGFEQAPVYAEETRGAQDAVARVVLVGGAFTAVLLVVSSWALTAAAGPGRIVALSGVHGPDLLFRVAGDALGPAFADVLHVLLATGVLVSAVAFHNVVARYAFAMGREGLLPALFARTRTGSGTPGAGSLLQTLVSAAAVAAFAVGDDTPAGDPTVPVLHMFAWGGAIGALAVLVLMATASCAVIVFFARRGAARAQRWRLLASAVAGLALLAVLAWTVRDFDVVCDSGPGAPLSWVLPAVVVAVAVLGVVQGAVLRVVRPRVHARIGLGHRAPGARALGAAPPPATGPRPPVEPPGTGGPATGTGERGAAFRGPGI